MRKKIAIASTTALLVAGGATGAALALADDDASTSAARAGDAVKAVRTAGAEGRAFDVESDRHRGKRVWEVDVIAGSGRAQEIRVSADGSKILHRGKARRSDDARDASQATVSLATALKTADGRASGGLDGAEIDREAGRLVWTASFERRGSETEVDVDAKSGKVLDVRTEREDDDGEDSDD